MLASLGAHEAIPVLCGAWVSNAASLSSDTGNGLFNISLRTQKLVEFAHTLTDYIATGGADISEFKGLWNAYFTAFLPRHGAATPAEERLMAEIRDVYTRVLRHPYPQGYSVSPWWDRKQLNFAKVALALDDPRHVILCAQYGSLSGFDHRLYDNLTNVSNLCFDKLQAIQEEFDTYLPWSSDIEESEFSIPSSITECGGRKYSSIFLTHYQFYLRVVQGAKGKPIDRVLEIGGGYGGLARIFKEGIKGVQYFIVDLMGSLVFSYSFLKMNFPALKVVIVSSLEDSQKDAIRTADFVLVPVQFISVIDGIQFDVAINTGSMQEMNQDAVNFFMDYIQHKTSVDYFYSFNYFISSKGVHVETSGAYDKAAANLICPQIDSDWEVVYARLNTPGLVNDCGCYNWLEILVKRDKSGASKKKARAHFLESARFPVMSDSWFYHAIAAVFIDRNPEHIKIFIDGIELFFMADCDIPNNYYHPVVPHYRDRRYLPRWTKLPTYGEMVNPPADVRRQLFNGVDEVRYFRTLLNAPPKTGSR